MTDPQADALIFAIADKSRECCPIDWLSVRGDSNAKELVALRAVVHEHVASASPESSR